MRVAPGAGGRGATLRSWILDAGLVACLAIGCFALRGRWAVPAYVHQNGQGALWVAYALRDLSGMRSYGPGYPELFRLAAHATPGDPERGLVALQGALSALAGASLFPAARSLGASRVLALAFAALVMVDPVTSRLAATESYCAAIGSLVTLGAAILVVSATRDGARAPWDARRVAFVAAGGLALTLAARIHPVAWAPAACAPLVVLLGADAPARLVGDTLRAASVVLLVCAGASGAALARVVRWTVVEGHSRAGGFPNAVPTEVVVTLVASIASLLGIAALLSRPRARGARLAGVERASRALAVAAVVAALATVFLTGRSAYALVASAHDRLFLAPLALALLTALLAATSSFARARDIAQLCALGGVALALRPSLARERGEDPTDVREASWLRSVRTALPEGSVVWSVQRDGQRIVIPPLYGAPTKGVVARAVEGAALPDDAEDAQAPRFYLEASLCDADEVRARCAAVRASAGSLQSFARVALPALPSMQGSGYAHDPVVVELFRVVPTRPPSAGAPSPREVE